MHLSPKFKGLSSIIGGCLIHLVLGSFYLWGSINLYAASYFKFNFDSFLSMEQTLIVFPLMSLSLHTTAPISVRICEKLGMRLHCYIFGIGIFILVFLSSYAKSFWYFVAFYSIGFGFCSGLIYLIPMYNAYKFFPEHRGLISGVITGSYGLGTIISNNIFLIALNPNNRQPFLHTDGNYYFSADISNRLPYGIKILSIYFLIMIVIGTSLLFEYEDEPEEVVVNVCSSEENMKEFLLEMVDEPVESSRSIMNEKIISKSKRSSPQLCRASIEVNYFQRQEKHRNPVYKSDIVLSGIKKRALFGSNIVKWSFRTQLPTDEANCESLSQALKSRSFYQIIFLLYCSSMGGFFLASNYKNYGILNIKDDRFLTFIGSMGALFNGGGRLIWGIFLDKYSFKNVYIVLILIQSIVLFTLNLISLYKISYLFWICIGLACEGGHFVLFPPLTIKVLGAYVGAQAYGILFYGFCLANLSQFGITYWFKNEMGYENELYFFGTFTIIAGISVIFFKIKFQK